MFYLVSRQGVAEGFSLHMMLYTKDAEDWSLGNDVKYICPGHIGTDRD